MSEPESPALTGVAASLLIPLCIRALEARRPDALVRDDQAVELVRRLSLDAERILAHDAEEGKVGALLRNREFDRNAREFIARKPNAVVVHIGCGLDSRFERVDNGQVEWFDLDLPQVTDLRRQLLGEPRPRQHLVAGSVLEDAWRIAVEPYRKQPFLFLAEGVFMYFTEEQVQTLVRRLREQFAGAELVFDAFSPVYVWASNLRYKRAGVGAPCHWALKRAQDLETWADGIRLLPGGEWYLFASSEPRLLQVPKIAKARWVLRIPFFRKAWGVFHYRLGSAQGGEV